MSLANASSVRCSTCGSLVPLPCFDIEECYIAPDGNGFELEQEHDCVERHHVSPDRYSIHEKDNRMTLDLAGRHPRRVRVGLHRRRRREHDPIRARRRSR